MSALNYQFDYSKISEEETGLRRDNLHYTEHAPSKGPIYSIWHGQRLGENDLTTAESIGIGVEFYGKPCMNPKNHPASPNQQYPLRVIKGTGCGSTLGEDPLAELADTDKELNFLYANDDKIFLKNLPKLDIALDGTQ